MIIKESIKLKRDDLIGRKHHNRAALLITNARNVTFGKCRFSNTRKWTLESGVRMLAVGFRFPARIIESLPLWTQEKLVGVMVVDFEFQWDSV